MIFHFLGSDITIVSFSRQVGNCIKAAAKLKEEGISAEVVNLRSIRPLDVATIINSVRKTGRCLTVEEGWTHFGVGSEISAQVMESKYNQSLIIAQWKNGFEYDLCDPNFVSSKLDDS